MREQRCTIPDMSSADLGSTGAGRPLELAFTDWGDPAAARTVLCLHGLTRNSRDFDFLAEALAADARVIALDIVGRGNSAWLADAGRYQAPTYVAHVAAFLAAMGLAEVDLVGTSMGGIIGMGLAASAPALVRRLVLNDVGGFIPKAALEPIAAYLGTPPPVFPDLAALERHLREIHQGFGPLTDAQWAHLARHSSRPAPGGLTMHYDPKIATPFLDTTAQDVELWPLYDAIACPALLLRGAESRLLPKAVAEAMTRRGPEARLATFAGVAHAPALMAEDQITTVRDFLAG